MRRNLSIFLFVLLCATAAIAGPAGSSLLPDEFGGWHATSPEKTVTPQELGPNGTTPGDLDAILKESGLKRIVQRTYAQGSDEVTLRAFAMKDPSSAFELYTFLLAPGMKNLGIGENSALSQYDGRVLIGNLVVQVNFGPQVKPEALNGLLEAVKSKVDRTPLPPLKDYLPKNWLVFGSEKYALGPEALRAALGSLDQGAQGGLVKYAGFESGAEAMAARYQSDHHSGVLLLLQYPTPQLAEQHLHHLETALSADAKAAGVDIERKASLLSIVLAAKTQESARLLRNDVNYATEITWNESSHTATDPPFLLVVGKIFLFTCIFLGVATGLGVAFGGARVLVKRLFPGKVFDRPQDVEVLQLGLSGKKIDPTDLY